VDEETGIPGETIELHVSTVKLYNIIAHPLHFGMGGHQTHKRL